MYVTDIACVKSSRLVMVMVTPSIKGKHYEPRTAYDDLIILIDFSNCFERWFPESKY